MPVDLSASIYAEYKRARKRAEEAERRGAQTDAEAAYRQAAGLMRKYAEYAQDASVRQQRKQRHADADAKKYSEMARKWEASGDCSARNFHEAGGAAIVGREIRDAIRTRGDT